MAGAVRGLYDGLRKNRAHNASLRSIVMYVDPRELTFYLAIVSIRGIDGVSIIGAVRMIISVV